MFAAPPIIKTTVFARLPDALRARGQASAWHTGRAGPTVDSFLEGPSVDARGHLICTDIANGRILSIDPQGRIAVVVEYDGEPNGLKIHADGRYFIADHRRGLMVCDPETARVEPILERAGREGFKGLNDLTFASNGDLYFTDQGQSGLHDPSGRVYRLRADGGLDCVLSGIPSPNGLALSPDEQTLFLNVTRANAVWRLPLDAHGHTTKVGTFITLSGGSGPDGLALDCTGNLAVAHPGLGCVWLFDPRGEPLFRVQSCTGRRTTNVAYGGLDLKTLFITESETATVLMAEMPVAGQSLPPISSPSRAHRGPIAPSPDQGGACSHQPWQQDVHEDH
jgi:gluconolactonase